MASDAAERAYSDAGAAEDPQHPGVGILTYDHRDGTWSLAPAAAAAALLGVGASYPRTRAGWIALVHAEDRAGFVAALDALPRVGVLQHLHRIDRPGDGALRWVAVSGKLRYDADGRPGTLQATVQDVTDRHRRDEAVRRQPGFLRALLQTIPDAVWLKDADGVFLACNQEFERLLGATEDEIVGKTDLDFVPPEAAEFFRQKDQEAVAAGETRHNEEWVVYADGRRALWDTAKTPMVSDGRLVGILGTARDITERRRAQNDLDQSQRQLREMFQDHTAPMLLVDPDGSVIVDANPAASALYGYPRDALVGTRFADLSQLDEAELTRDHWEALTAGRSYRVSAHRLASGEERMVESWISPTEAATGPLLFVILHDVTERVRAERRLRMVAKVFTQSHDGVVICDADERIVDANPAFTAITGFTREEVLGETPRVLASGRHDPTFFASMWNALSCQGYWEGEVWNRRKSGELYATHTSIAAVTGDHDEITHYIGTFSDITALKGHQAQLERLAHHDPLTGLANRLLLGERFEWALAQARRHPGHHLAVCYLDLDAFKPINDTHGHDVGDLLLVAIGNRLSRSVRAIDTVARLGGDEFVLLLTGLSGVDQCVALIQRVLHAVTQPIAINGLDFSVTASVGIALAPEDGTDADTLLRHADQAMYQAKQAGKNGIHLFDRAEEHAARVRRRQRERVSFGLGAGEFRLHYQPKVDMVSGAVVGVEALVRWEHPDRGLLLPAEFLPWIDGTDLDAVLGRWVLDEAIRQVSAWRSDGLALGVSVNVSPAYFQRPGFVDEVAAALRGAPELPPRALELEIHESAALNDLDAATALLDRCHALGVAIALDDFGTGYSSLTYLRQLPIDTVKLDPTFVGAMTTSRGDLAIVQCVIELSKAFDRAIVAEGVETIELGTRLIALGCAVGQGYGVAAPMPPTEIPGWIARFTVPEAWAHPG